MKPAIQDKGFVICPYYNLSTRVIYALFDMFPLIKKIWVTTVRFSGKKNKHQSSVGYWAKYILRGVLCRAECRVHRGNGHGAGILDRTELMAEQIILALAEEKIPVIPPLVLAAQHSYGKWVYEQWHKYYDMQNISVSIADSTWNFNEYRAVTVIYERDFFKTWWWRRFLNKCRVFRSCGSTTGAEKAAITRFRSIRLLFYARRELSYRDGGRYKVMLSPSGQVAAVARKVTEQLGKYHALHIRRRDREDSRLSWDQRIAALQQLMPSVPAGGFLYFMTDKKNESLLAYLRRHYTVFQHHDFAELTKINSDGVADNYFLFTVERVIFASAEYARSYVITKEKIIDQSDRMKLPCKIVLV